MSVYSADQLNSMDETDGITPIDIFLRFEFPKIQSKIIDAAKRGKKEYSFYAPKGIDFSRYFPRCSITNRYSASCGYTSFVEHDICYVISWRASSRGQQHSHLEEGTATGADSRPHSSMEYCAPIDRLHRAQIGRRFDRSVVPPFVSGTL